MFNFGRSSVLGNRDDSTKMTRNLINDDNWYSLYNGPYEASPRATTPQRHKQRDSWGDPIPFGDTSDILEPSGDGGLFEKRKLQQYEPRDIKYGVRGVFDDDWKQGGTSGIGRIGVSSEKERGRRVSCGRDQTQSFPDPHKSTFPMSRRRSTVSSGNSLTVPNHTPLYGVSGGVGESPVPQRRAQKDANRISLGSIFTFGSKTRMSSPSRTMDEVRKEREENIGVRPTSNPEKGRVPKLSSHEKNSNSNKRKNKQTGYSALSNEKEDYRDYYNSLYSTFVDEGNKTLKNDPSSTRQRKSPEQFRHPASTLHDSRAEKPGQPRRASSRQNLTVTSVGHPYAPYAYQGQDYHVRGARDEKLFSPTSDDAPPILHQSHPYNQAQPIYTRHPYGQSSVSTGASSPSHITAAKRGSGQSEHHGDCHLLISHGNTTTVASGIGITNTIGGVGLGPGVHGKKLKISRSTPNFHHTQIIVDSNSTSGPSNPIPRSAPPMPLLHMKQIPPPRPKDRWLSAETWCDALLFPRPKLKLKQGKNATIYSQGDESFIGGPAPSGSGRIISPPPSPVVGEWDIEINDDEAQLQSRLRDQQAEGSGEGGAVQKQREPGIPSRVLAHSKSFELHKKSGKEKAGYISDIESRAVRQGKAKAVPAARDRSDTQEILPPPTSVPDLDEVLSKGRLLDEERQAWQSLAVNSFGNKRSRSLSRTRTKSLTGKGRSTMRRKERNTCADESDGQVGEHEGPGQSSFEYLAAQACLGNQTASATFIVPSPNSDDTKASGVHSHSNSHSTTTRTIATKSSKSQPKAHSRNNSTGNSGVNAGRISVSKLCGNMGLDVDPDLDHVERANLVSHAATQGTNSRTAPDLERALKRHGTKVIRLADPAQPVSPNPQSQRKTPSPDLSVSNLSAISHSKVGIAIGTPPEEAEGAAPAIVPAGPTAISASYVPSHPYAQGGLSFSVQTSSGRERPIDPTGVSSSKVPSLSEILARHKVSSHPYALTSGNTAQEQSIQPSSRLGINVTRDSYLAANGLIGQFRSDDRQPDPSRMWAQLSPDVIREILPGDLQYSPYDSDLDGIERLEGIKISGHHRDDERMRSIHDTAGVAEALLSATRYERDKKVLHEEHNGDDRVIEQVDIPETMQPNEKNVLVGFNDLRKPSHASSAHTIASSHLGGAAKSPSTRPESLDDLETASHAPTSGSPSPGFRVLGSPNDLDSFQDLFYQPSTTDIQDSPVSPDDTANVMSWDTTVRNRRAGSGLTSLARQLGEEYEALVSDDTNRVSQGMPLHSRSLSARPHHSDLSTEGDLQFVLEEMAPADSPHRTSNDHETVHVFESANLPEDVYSLQASSITDGNGEDDDPTGLLRLGTVESLSTPAAVDVEHRISFNGETVFDYEDQDAPVVRSSLSTNIEHPGNAISRRDLLPIGSASQRPLTQVSCMTTSDLSRMSGLSDFPVPPKSIYSEPPESTLPQSTAPFPRPEDVKPPSSGPPSSPVISRKPLPQGGQVEFGVDQSAVELAKSLSSPEQM